MFASSFTESVEPTKLSASLEMGDFSIFREFDDQRVAMCYYAWNPFTGEVLSVAIDSDGKIVSPSPVSTPLADQQALAAYAGRLEAATVQTVASDKAGVTLNKLKVLEEIGKDRYSTYNKELDNLNSILDSTSSAQDLGTVRIMAHLTSIVPSKDGFYGIRLMVDRGAGFEAESNTTSSISRFPSEDFDRLSEEDKQLLYVLSTIVSRDRAARYGGYHHSSAILRVHPESLAQILVALKGREIDVKGKTYTVDPEVRKIGLSFDAEGRISVPKKVPAQAVDLGKISALFDDRTRTVRLFDLGAESVSKIVRALSFSEELSGDRIPEAVKERIYGIAAPYSEVDPVFRRRMRDREGFISIYVELNARDDLVFTWKYTKDGKVLTKEEAQKISVIKECESKLLGLASQMGLKIRGTVDDSDKIALFLKADLSPLQRHCEFFLAPELQHRKSSTNISISVSRDSDWLDLRVTSDGLSEEEVKKVLQAYRLKKRFARLKGSVIMVDQSSPDAAYLREIAQLMDEEDEGKDIPLYRIFGLLNAPGDVSVTTDERIEEVIRDIANYKNSSYTPEDRFLKVMRPYQVDGYKWLSTLAKYHMGGILADDMGLGKTLETISFMCSYKVDKPMLTVCPKSVIYNWQAEVRRWDSDLPVVIIAGDKDSRKTAEKTIDPDRKALYVISYDSLRSDIDTVSKIDFGLVILDEAQFIKNTRAQKTRATKKLKADQRFVLTGTPIENSIVDMWSIFDFLMPGYLMSEASFTSSYAGVENLVDDKALERLKAKVKPFILRRTKEEVLTDLPPLTEAYITVSMKDKQRELYDSYLQDSRNRVKTNPKDRIMILAALTRLRQICVDPRLFIDNYDEAGEKIEYAADVISTAVESGHKVLLFSSFKSALELMYKELDSRGIKWYSITGDASAKERLEIAEDFNQPGGVAVCLISLKAGGTGLNLTGADIVIHLDPWWNVAAESQASDRAHRIGQTRPVTVYKLICKDSVEEKVVRLQDIKRELSESLIPDADSLSNITQSDIDFLLSQD